MHSHRRTAITAGVLFIIGTVAGIASEIFAGPIHDPKYLAEMSANENTVVIRSILVLIMGFALAMVPVVLFPVFTRFNKVLAIGAIVFRGALEAVLYIGVVVSTLILLTLSNEYVAAVAPDAVHFETLGALIIGAGFWTEQMLSLVFSIGALMIYFIFFQSKLIPRWLSGWGLAGAVLYLAAAILSMFGSVMEYLMIPLAIQEMVLAVWLIAKGFNSSVIDSVFAKTDTNETVAAPSS